MDISGSTKQTGFFGLADGKIDKKNRVQIPAVFRKKLPDDDQGVMLMRGRDPEVDYLEVWTAERWNAFYARAEEMLGQDDFRELLVGYLNHSTPCNLDKQDRLVVPPAFKKMGGISETSGLVWVGAGMWFELWTEENYALRDGETRRKAFTVLRSHPDLFKF